MIPCANCSLCRVFVDNDGYRKVRCAAEMWKTPANQEKVYSYHTVLARRMLECEFYDSMGDPTEYLRQLEESLPPTKGMSKPEISVARSGMVWRVKK